MRTPKLLATALAGAVLTVTVIPGPAAAIDGTETITVIAGTGTSGSSVAGQPAATSPIYFPSDVTVGPDGDLYYIEADSKIFRIDDNGIIRHVAGTGSSMLSGDGSPATQAGIRPSDLAFSPDGLLFFTDLNSVVRFIDAAGNVQHYAGINNTNTASGDGGVAATTSLFSPRGLDFDNAGNLYIADQGSNRVRMIDTANPPRIWTAAGTGNKGYSGNGGDPVNADLNLSGDLAVGPTGRVFIGTKKRVRSFSTRFSGTIETVAGTGTQLSLPPSMVSGPATTTPVGHITGLAFDSTGTLHISSFGQDFDSFEKHGVVQRLDADTLTVVLGGEAFPDADLKFGASSLVGLRIGRIFGITFDADDNLYLAETSASKIYRVSAPSCRQGPIAAEWDTNNPARASVYRLYCAYFLRFPDHGGYDYWYDQYSNQVISLTGISDFFSASDEFNLTYGPLSNDAFLDLLYGNVFDRVPDPGGRAYWLNILDTGVLTKGGVVLQFSDSQEFRNQTGTP